MTQQNSLKRRARIRMQKTGERYTTARAQILAAHEAETGVSDDAITKATGRGGEEWLEILDQWGALDRTHKEIATYLMQEHEVPGWWAQSVTVLFERARGLREVGQRADGTYYAGGSKTVNVDVETLFDAFADPEIRARWLTGIELEAKTITRPKYIRFDLPDGTRVVAGMGPKGESKSNVGIEHARLPGPEAREELKAIWRQRLGDLKRMLEG